MEIKLSPAKYFNQRLLNFTQMFASDPDYVFFFIACDTANEITTSD